CFAEGPNHIYLAQQPSSSQAGNVIYKTAVKPDGTSLDVPTVAARLPDGEEICGLFGYLGYVFIAVGMSTPIDGKTFGVRMASPTSDGSLIIGSVIPFGDGSSGFTTMAGYGPFVFVPNANLYSATGPGGVVRLDLRHFIGDLTP